MVNASALLPFIEFFGVYQPQPFIPLTNNHFASEFSALVVYNKFTENVVYSPVFIHSSLALILMGTASYAESAMRNALKLGKEPKESLAIKYGFFFYDVFENQNDGQQLLISNGLFISDKAKILKGFSDLASYYFKIQMVNLDFSQAQMASKRINDWVSQQTNDHIRDLIQSQSLSNNTKAVLVNAIYFKGIWQYAFNADNTKKRDFYISPSHKVPVDTMFMNYYFRYVDLPMLKAQALELPLINSNMSMLIILPYEIDGLQNLEIMLKGIDLNQVTALMKTEYVNVYLPKFRIESMLDLKDPLKRMGLFSLFKNAKLTHMFKNALAQEISDVTQKTIITCNEEGAEAVSLTSDSKSLGVSTGIHFHADHPFVFVIRSKTMQYFFGHVAKF